MAINEPRCLPDGTIQDSVKINIPIGAANKLTVILPSDTFMLQFLGSGSLAITSEDAAANAVPFTGVPGNFYAVGPDCDRVQTFGTVANTGYLVCYRVNPRADNFTGRY